MEWINVNNELPRKYEEVIVATIDGAVKSTTHVGNGKFTTYLTVTHWMHFPQAPQVDDVSKDVVEEQVVKKKRGRPRKV